MAVDVASYSRLMGADEVGTLTALKEHRRERVDPVIARHNGRIVKTAGDGLLAEFASVVDAVGCAVAIQRAMLAFNTGIHADRRIVLRIGINIGDIIIDGNDIFGDGVNVAARLEALCEPGGVCISRSANDQVRDKLSLSFADLGEQTVKNIARAVGVFGLAPSDIAALPEDELPNPEPPETRTPLMLTRRLSTRGIAAGAVVAVAILAGGWWMLLHARTAQHVAAIVAPMAPRPVAFSPQDRRQSVIVLPFENSSGDPAQDGLAARMTRDVMDLIAEDNTIPLVPAATAARYQGKSIDLRTIGRDHDLHFALTGKVRREEAHLIASVTLYETVDDRTVWSRRFDVSDGPNGWKGIIQGIYANFQRATIDVEAAHAKREHPDSLDKRDLMFAAWASSLSPLTKANNLTRIALVERALAIDPNYVSALRTGARLHADLVMDAFSSDREADLAYATKLIDRALLLSPDDVLSQRQKANVLRAQGNWGEAAALLHEVIPRLPVQGLSYRELGWILMSLGRHKEALENLTAARQLITDTEPVPLINSNIASALLANDRFTEAIVQARLAIAEYPPESGREGESPWLVLIAAESVNGEDAKAREDLQRFLATPRTYGTMAAIRKRVVFARNPRLLEGLRRAGMPEE
jgi:TolB-like protein